MCFGGGSNNKAPETPAPAPAPPIQAPEPPTIGESRRKESREMFDGKDSPNYRVRGRNQGAPSNRPKKTMPQANPGGPITM